MKRKLLLAAATLCLFILGVGGNSVWAYGWSDSDGATVSTGEYYLYNLGSQRFMTQGCWWGTHMAADGAGKVITISGSANAYNMHMAGIDAAKYLSGGDYVDTGAATGQTATTDKNLQWTFTLVSGTSNTYTIKNNSTGKYLHSINSASGTPQFNTGHSVESGESVTDNDNTYYWLLIPKADRETLTASTTVYPIDATHLVTNPDGEWYIRNEENNWKEYTHGGWSGNFGHNSSNEEYYFASFYEIWVGYWNQSNGTQVGNVYHLNDFDEYNNITNLPNGKYCVTMTAGAVQQDDPEEVVTGAYIYANSEQTAVTTRGNYSVECVITDGTIKAGMKTVSTTANWASFDNLRLTYLEPCVSAVAVDLPEGGAMTAGQWYKCVIAEAEYTISATTAANIVVTTDGTQLLGVASGDDLETGTAVNLTAGTYYYKSTSANTLTVTINDPIQPQRDVIIAQKGDLTSLVNGTFQDNVDGWTGGSHITWVTGRGWRGDNATKFYERSSNGELSYTLANMPAGTYKVVAAARGYDGGKITPEIAGTKGTTLNCVGDARSDKSGSEINTNGVEMPYSELGGFTTDAYGHNWKWITATGTLADDGDLVIKFNCEGNQWMCIDDVHLYCTELAGTSYTRTVGDGQGTISTNNSVVTADIILDNPNTVLRTTGAITTAAGQNMNNDQYNSSRITKLVLYDGYDYTKLTDAVGADNGAVLYRSIPADTWCTLTVPFWPTTTSLTMKYPTTLSAEGVLSFADVDKTTWGAVDKPMLIKSASAITAIEGKLASTNGGGCGVGHSSDMTSGTDVPMQGVYEAGKVPVSNDDTYYYYIDAEDGELHKVTGDGVNIGSFRAYFSLSQAEADAPMRSTITLDFEGLATGISQVADKSVEENKAYYNLNGQRVAAPTKGIYILNGKKVYVK